MTFVAGIDGAPGGWIIASVARSATGPSRAPTLTFVERIDQVIDDLLGDHSVVSIDIPIGLPADGQRPADGAARALLGSRRSTFFPTPARAVLDHESWDSASAASRRVSGKGLSKQAWNLVPKIREVDVIWRDDLRHRLVEGHPECSFAQMSGSPLVTRKSTPEGRAERLALLAENLSPACAGVVENAAWPIDTTDALALAWTARRISSGDAIQLGSPDDLDPSGRPMLLRI